MPKPSENLAKALEVLHKLQEAGHVAIYTGDIPGRQVRERLVKNGFIKEVTKGWYITSGPDESTGDSTSWYTSYWEFCSRYLNHKYGDDWCLSPDMSLQLNTGNWSVPTQLIVRSPKASNSLTRLPYYSSMFNLKSELPQKQLLTVNRAIRLYTLEASLIYCPVNLFTQNPIDTRTALAMIRNASELLPFLLEKGHTVYAGRLAGAFRNIGKDKIADEILDAMRETGYDARETDPFNQKLAIQFSGERSPFVIRVRLMWQQMREQIIKVFPVAPGIPADKEAYLKDIQVIYVTDAYHSLSIERYKVSPQLIERVRRGQWDKDSNEEDKKHRDAMAARGYFLAFQQVSESIGKILKGENPGTVADDDHSRWHLQLFGPSVNAGLLRASDLAGYRNLQVYIGGSKHIPPNVDNMRDVMPLLFELLEQEPEASVRAVLGHFIFVFIHPYGDGNGRMGRFLMNAMLASGGYPWTVIPVEQREVYMKALETASVEQQIEPFAQFIAHLVKKGMEGKPEAVLITT